MRKLAAAALALTVLLVSACMPKKLPGTDIDDNTDTRAVLDVANRYRMAVEQKDAQAIIALADPSFRDDGGSASPDDDLDFKSLYTALPARFSRIDDVHLSMDVRKMDFDEVLETVKVSYQYTISFRMPSLSSKATSETDLKQMTMKRVNKAWKITSGI